MGKITRLKLANIKYEASGRRPIRTKIDGVKKFKYQSRVVACRKMSST